MIRTDEQWVAIADLFNAAALDGNWPRALDALADACRADSGELIGVGADTAVPFNWVTRKDPCMVSDFETLGFGNPVVNPRVSHGMRDRIMQAYHDVQCSTDEELRRNFAYADYCRYYDIPYGSQTTLMRENGMLIGLAVLRGEVRGVPQGAERQAFEAISPHVRSAVMTQMAVERQGAALISGALEGLSIAGFLCDRMGLVRAMTPAAEAALSAGALRLTYGRLGARRPEDARALEGAIAAAGAGAMPGRLAHSTIVVRHSDTPSAVEVLDVVALPSRDYAFGFEPRVLIAVRGYAQREQDLPGLLARAFTLTPVEARIAARLADGESRETIAAERDASVETIRSHIKKIFAKVDVRREAELAARLRRLF